MTAVSIAHDDKGAGSDRLTGLHDRGECVGLLAALIADSRGQDAPVAVLWVDIDRFRQVNHSFGYVVGDSVLVELARRLERARPAQASLARVGGDEFVLLLPAASQAELEGLGQGLVHAVHQALGVGKTRIRPSASIGLVQAQPEEDAHELLERAQRAMAEAKREGGGRTWLAGETRLPARDGKYLAREELAVEETLHRALEMGSLYLDYQPIVRIADGAVLAVEALMRCQVDGLVMAPGRFIPVAEKTGLISHLGDWSLITAAGFVSRLRGRGLDLKVAVNVSRSQLQTPAFTKSLHGVLAYTGIEAGQLELEITESLFMDSSDTVRRNLRAAVAAGFPLALDDFGTGYSSLACLKDMPAAKIKLDRAFVVDLPYDRRGAPSALPAPWPNWPATSVSGWWPKGSRTQPSWRLSARPGSPRCRASISPGR
jgi:diguanylate cyclase (GGDEF)-like protein